MHASDLPASPDLAIQPIPVICDQCRQTGLLGEGPFSALPDILSFTPVPRRAHVNAWTPEHQRAFIAALAITGSPRQAARAIGRHQFGAESLRTAKGGKGFAAAWDAALDLARERETHRIHGNLAELAERREAELASIAPSPARGRGRLATGERGEGSWGEGPRPIHPDCDYDPDLHADDYPEYWETMRSIRGKLLACRRFLLMTIAPDPDKRRAWEVLVGPVDWDRAERMEPQDDEPQPVRWTGENSSEPSDAALMKPHGMPNMRKADMVLTVESGLLPDLTGGHDALAELRAEQSPLPAGTGEGGSPRAGGASSVARPAPTRYGIDFETDAMLDAIAAAREAHPEEDWD
jgi:hypothetical protein